MRCVQFLVRLASGDAVSNEVLAISRLVQKWGFSSAIFSINTDLKLQGLSEYWESYQYRNDDVVIYHHSVGSPLPEFLAKRVPVSRLIMIYHNITPQWYLSDVNWKIALACQQGRQQLRYLSNKVSIGVADSEYNRAELVAAGYTDTVVVPIVMDMSRFNNPYNNHTLGEYGEASNLLFVGRIAPNKRVDDLLKIFTYYQKCIDEKARLLIVGSWVSLERYYDKLVDYVKTVGLRNVIFAPDADSSELASYYRVAKVFVTMSEHEGFCVPLLEAMYFKVPIVAYAAAAIPEVLGGSGILVRTKNFDEIAELINLLIEDSSVRNQVIESQLERYKLFTPEKTERRLRQVVEHVIGKGRLDIIY